LDEWDNEGKAAWVNCYAILSGTMISAACNKAMHKGTLNETQWSDSGV